MNKQERLELDYRLGKRQRPDPRNVVPFPLSFPPVNIGTTTDTASGGATTGVQRIEIAPPNVEAIKSELDALAKRIALMRAELGLAEPTSILTMRTIILTVCKFYGIALKDIVSERKFQNVVRPRFVAAYLIRELLATPTTAIGRALGGRDHSTIINAMRKIERDRLKEPLLDGEIIQLTALLKLEEAANV